jgi:citrate lyase beta subunit
VGILERCADTKAAITKYLPFMAPFYLDSCDEDGDGDDKKGHNNTGTVSKGELTPEQVKVIKRLARYEEEVYQQANKMLDEQMLQ